MATTNQAQDVKKFTENEERDGFVEYCKLRTCERMEVERADDLDDEEVDKMRVIAIESKIEWRGFTDEMKQFWIERGSVKSTLNAWTSFMKDSNVSVPSVYASGAHPQMPGAHAHAHPEGHALPHQH